MDKKLKIVYVITGLELGGAETIAVNLLQNMKKHGHFVSIISLTGDQIIQVPSDIPTYNIYLRKTFFSFLISICKVKKIIKEINPNIIHAHMFHAIFFSRILRLFIHIPYLISTDHTLNGKNKTRLFLYRITDFLSDLNTNVSKKATEFFIKKKAFSKNKSYAVYNGIDLTRFSKKKSVDIRKEYLIKYDSFVYLNISRLMPVKDHINLLKAFSIVHSCHNNCILICVGDGKLLCELKNKAKELNIDSSVIFSGAQSNVEDFYNAADCFVLSSAWEGFGLVLAEAMACELPVISTDCGGTAEVVQDDKFIVPIQNPDVLAEKMKYIFQLSAEERSTIGLKNRALVQKFDLKSIVDQWLLIYKDLLNTMEIK